MARRSNIDGSLPQNVSIKKTNADFSSLTKTEQNLAKALVDTLFAKHDDLRETLYLKGVMRIDLILGRIEGLLDKKLNDFTETQKENVKSVILDYLNENKPTKTSTTYSEADIRDIIESIFAQGKDEILKSLTDLFESQKNTINDEIEKTKNTQIEKPLENQSKNIEEPKEDGDKKEKNIKQKPKKENIQIPILIDDIFKSSILERIYEMEKIISQEIDNMDGAAIELIKNTKYTIINSQQKESDKSMDMIVKMMNIIENALSVIPIEEILKKSNDMVQTIGQKIDIVCTILSKLAEKLIQAIQPMVNNFATQMIVAYYSSPLGIIVLLLSAVVFGIVYFFKDSKKFLEMAINIGTIFVKVMLYIAAGATYVLDILTCIVNILNRVVGIVLSALMWLVRTAWTYIIKPILLALISALNFVKDVILPPILAVFAWIVEKFIDAWWFIYPYVRDLVLFITDILIWAVDNLLIPILTPCLNMLNMVLTIITPILTMLTNVVFAILYKVLSVIKPVVTTVAKFLAEGFIKAIETLDMIFGTFKDIGEKIMKIPETIANLGKLIWDKILAMLPKWLQEAIAFLCGALGAAWDAIKNVCAAVWDGVKNVVSWFFGGGPDIDELKERYDHLKWAWWTLGDARRYKYDQMRYALINEQSINEIKIILDNISSNLTDLYDTLLDILSNLPLFLQNINDDNKEQKISDSKYDDYITVINQKLDVIHGIRESVDVELEISLSDNNESDKTNAENAVSNNETNNSNNTKTSSNEDMWLDSPTSAYDELLNKIHWVCIEKFALTFMYARERTKQKSVPIPVPMES